MKLLLVVPSQALVHSLIQQFETVVTNNGKLPFLQTTKLLHHEVDILVALGFGTSLTYQLTKVLTEKKYHLALKFSFANAYSEATPIGTVFNIVNEKPGDAGMQTDDVWLDVYDLKWLDREEPPHVRGGFVNMTNAYMNVFMPYKKVVGLTVNHMARIGNIQTRKEHYKAEVETSDGLSFVYPSLAEQQTYYHLAMVKNNLVASTELKQSDEHLVTEMVSLIKKL